MDMDTVKHLFTIIPDLKRIDSPEAQGLAEYLEKTQQYYNVFHNLTLSFDERIRMLEDCIDYFKSLIAPNTLPDDSVHHLCVTKESLIKLNSLHITLFGTPLQKIAHFGTDLVENFFSIIRKKCRYPNLFQFAMTYEAATREFMKQNSRDTTFSYPLRKKTNYYGHNEGTIFDISLIQYLTPVERKQENADLKKENEGTEEQKALCRELAKSLAPTKRVLLIREATCKALQNKVGIGRLMKCGFENCLKTYKLPGARLTHLRVCHGVSEDKLLDYGIPIEAIEEEAMEEALLSADEKATKI